MLKLILPNDHIEHSLCGLKKTFEHYFFIISYESIVLLCEFTLLEGKKNFEETLHLQPRPHVYFTLLTLMCKLPLIAQISVETNMSLFAFLDACLFGHPVYFDYQDFFTLDQDLLSFPSDFFIQTYG